MDIYKLLPHFLQFLGNPLFCLLAIAAGFYGLIRQSKREELLAPVPAGQLVHPVTKLPISSKRRMWPKIKRPVWTCAIVALFAVPVWSFYRTPLHDIVWLEVLPDTSAHNRPIVPDLHYGPLLGVSSPSSHARTSPLKSEVALGATSQNTTPRPNVSAPFQPFSSTVSPAVVESDPVACPTPGTLALGWTVALDKMSFPGQALPIENGPIKFTGSMDTSKLHPTFRNKFGVEVPQLKGSRYAEAKAFLDEIRTHTGNPTPRTIRPTEKLNRFVSQVERVFPNPQLNVGYADGASGDSEQVAGGSVLIPFATLSGASQAFIAKLDAAVRSGADKSCNTYMKYLKGED